MTEKIIGVVGGVGPLASIQLIKYIFTQTEATSDQEHLRVAMLSFSDLIPDRTDYIIGKGRENPAYQIVEVIKGLANVGASVVGIPCNTAHAPQIFNKIIESVEERDLRVKVLNMVEEELKFVDMYYSKERCIGLLATMGTYKSVVYQSVFGSGGYEIIVPPEWMQKEIHNAVYNSNYGIKTTGTPVSDIAKQKILRTIEYLIDKGCRCIISGCTELSLAIRDKFEDVILIDSVFALARALIREVNPDKLKTFKPS